MKQAAKTFEGVRYLQAQAEKTPWKFGAYGSVYGLVLSAWQNADDTKVEQGKEPIADAEWVEIFFGSLVSLLSDSAVSKSVRGWFERRGVRC